MTKKWSSIKKEKGATPWEYGDIVRDPAGIILMYVSQARNGGVLMMPVAWPASRTAFSQGLMMWYGENNRLEAVE